MAMEVYVEAGIGTAQYTRRIISIPLPTVLHFVRRHSALLAGLGIGLSAYYLLRVFAINGRRCPSEARIDGKTVIVTGGNTGIGKTTAIMLAQRGGRVILACRDLTKGAAALEEVKKKSGNTNVILKSLDLASTASIREFAQDILNTEERIDILLLNAGVMLTPHLFTQDGFELQFGVNHLGHFLLTHLLLDKLKTSAPSRVVCVSSRGHLFGTLNYEDMMWNNGYSSFGAYTRSKLANVMFARELSRRLEGTGVTTSSLHPGSIDTDLTRYATGNWYFFLKPIAAIVKYLFMKTPEQGSQTSLYCCVAEEVAEQSGAYYSDCRVNEPLSIALDDEECKKLWEYSLDTLNLK